MAILKYFYSIVQKTFEVLGLNLVITRRSRASKAYQGVAPKATYSPWAVDSDFMEVYGVIKNNTLVDQYRCYDLWQLVQESSKLEGALVEVGVWRGGTGALIARSAEMAGIKDTVYLCDTFTGVVNAGEKDSNYVGGEHSDTSAELVQSLLDSLNITNTKMLKGIFPEETGSQVNEMKFRFCHVDVDVYQSAKNIVEWIWPKLSAGGIIVFDDYGFQGCDGVTQYVNEEREKKDRLVFHNLNGHAVIVKKA